ncbi:lysostaphin resistance A-like protein [Liberiplasma polymorphum]|uniref:CPBP family intramembrane glutamic endopeptidase n=1 Tax=Liberiplasma polymorphum TaxID=3374570 RepID=UPI003775F8A7
MKLNPLLKTLIIMLALLMPLIASWFGRLFADLFSYNTIDPDGVFAWLYVHHILQMIVIILIILVIKKFTTLTFGFTSGNKEVGLAFVKKFTLYFFIYNVVLMVILVLSNQVTTLPFPINARNVTGYLSFQLFMSGPSEEILFRAFIMTIVGFFISKRVLSDRFSIANILAALVFVVAHIAFTLNPFSMSYQPIQLMYSLVLGLIYGICYEKTNSVFYPMALHSISNVISVSALLIVQSIFI